MSRDPAVLITVLLLAVCIAAGALAMITPHAGNRARLWREVPAAVSMLAGAAAFSALLALAALPR